MTRWAVEKLRCWAPEDRLVWAVRVLIWSLVLGVLNMTAWALGAVSDTVMLAITAGLSWLALTLTMADVVIGTDVRSEQEAE